MKELPLDPDKLAADVGKELIRPLYDDLVHPPASEVGKTLGGVVRVALSPLNGLIWGFDRMASYLDIAIPEKLKNVDPLKIKTPPIEVAGPAIEAMRYIRDNETLKDLFASLLASAMNEDTAHKAHPSFVELLKNLSRDEAIIIKHMVTVIAVPVIDAYIRTNKSPSNSSLHENMLTNLRQLPGISTKANIKSCIDNLLRLRIVEIDMSYRIGNMTLYDPIIKDCEVRYRNPATDKMDYILEYKRGIIGFTMFGKNFCECVIGGKPAVITLLQQ